MITFLKHIIIKKIEKIPLLQILIYNNLNYFKFLFPHDKDYYALKILFKQSEKRAFLDIGGNIGLSTIGFRELGFKKNKILVFEPDLDLIKNYLNKIKNSYDKINVFPFGLSSKDHMGILHRAYYKNIFFHFNNSFDKGYLKKKLLENYGTKSKKFKIKSLKFKLKKFDNLKIEEDICFIKIDVEGFDHLVLYGMKNFIKKKVPTILIEYNHSNFRHIYNFLNKFYDCYFYDFFKNKLILLSKIQIKMLQKGIILEKKFKKNSVNIFFLKKNY